MKKMTTILLHIVVKYRKQRNNDNHLQNHHFSFIITQNMNIFSHTHFYSHFIWFFLSHCTALLSSLINQVVQSHQPSVRPVTF